jgi:hypothetical protein
MEKMDKCSVFLCCVTLFGFQAGYSSPTQSAIREDLSLSLAEVC